MKKLDKIIVIRPIIKGDEVTPITFQEAQEVIDYAKQKNVEVIDIAKEKAVRGNVEKVLRKNPNLLVLHANHGNDESWIGSDGKACVNLSNVKLLANRESYANNCSSAKKLGVEAWKLNGTYWGYRDVFVFTTTEEQYFKQFVNYGIKLRIDGNRWKICLKKTKDLATKLIDKLVKNGKALAAACMHHDSDALVLYSKNNPPESNCNFRKVSVRLFGHDVGWKISWKTFLGWLFAFTGWGIVAHDFAHQVWELKGTVFSVEGGYVGLILLLISFIMLFWEHVKWLKG